MSTKRCCHCKRTLPIDEFPKNRSTKDGYCAFCRDCRREMSRRFVSLDRPLRIAPEKTMGDVIARIEQSTDETYERVFAALRYWMQDGTLKPTQAEAIYLYAVELFTYEEIGEMVGRNWQTVMYHYKRGIERLRQRYDAEAIDVAV